MDDDNLPSQCHPRIELNKKKKQFCGYCHEDKCLLDCKICNSKKEGSAKCEC